MPLPPTLYKPARHILAAVAVSCILFTALSILATLAAGTIEMDGDYPNGVGYLLFEDLAPVRFWGILPASSSSSSSAQSSDNNNNTTTTILQTEIRSVENLGKKPYQVKISLFLSAMGYTYSQSPRWSTSTGIIHNTAYLLPSSPSIRLPADLALVARGVDLPEEDYRCLLPRDDDNLPTAGPLCGNEFLQAWLLATTATTTSQGVVDEVMPVRAAEFDMSLAAVAYLAALGVLLGWVVVRQVSMFSHVRRLGTGAGVMYSPVTGEPCSDGPEVCGVNVGESSWSWSWRRHFGRLVRSETGAERRKRVRLEGLVITGVLYAVGVGALVAEALWVKSYMDEVERRMLYLAERSGASKKWEVEGRMDAEVGTGFLLLSAVTLVAIVVAWVCFWARDKLRIDDARSKGFMLVAGGEEFVEEDSDNAFHDEVDDAGTHDNELEQGGIVRVSDSVENRHSEQV